MLKKFMLVSACSLICSVSAYAVQINNFSDFADALKSGDHFSIEFDMSKCTGTANMPVGVFFPDALMLVPAAGSTQAHIAASDLHFSNVSGQPLDEYMRYTFNADDSVELDITDYNPVTYQAVGATQTMNCDFDNGSAQVFANQ